MNTTSTLALALSLCLAVAVQDKKPEDPTQRLASLEQEVAAQKRANAQFVKELKEQRAQLDKTVRYLNEQAKAAEALVGTLEASEKAGFTFGINPESREVLLRGWREALAAAQKDVPAPPPASNGQNAANGARER
jgi:septal ring factor EnvC (AmiA/AmiB activator)